MLAAALIAAGCEADPPIGRPADWPVSPLGSRACVERLPVQAYLVQMKKRVTSVWKLPAWRTASENVVIGIIVDAHGGVVRAAVFEASDGALARSALDAASEAAPFPSRPARSASRATDQGQLRESAASLSLSAAR